MKFKQRTNVANILDEIFNWTDSLIRSKVKDLDNPNNVKKKLANKKRNQLSLSTVPGGIFFFYYYPPERFVASSFIAFRMT